MNIEGKTKLTCRTLTAKIFLSTLCRASNTLPKLPLPITFRNSKSRGLTLEEKEEDQKFY